MTTWATLLVDVRIELDDDPTDPKWTDGLLYLFVKDAVRDYSYYFPLRKDEIEIAISGSSFPLPSNYMDIISVESPLGTFLKQREEFPGRKYAEVSDPMWYRIEGNAVYISGDVSEIYLTYYSLHEVPASSSDVDFELTIPDRDLELIRLYMKGKIDAQIRGKQAKLDRFEIGSGRRDDNPLAPEVDDTFRDYYRRLGERMRGGVIRLYKV